MEKLVVGQIYTKEQEYTGCRECHRKQCTCGKNDMGIVKFTTYSAKVGDRYYTIKGWGAKNVKEGDTIEGEISSKEYNGKTYYEIKLPKPDPMAELTELKKAVELQDSRIFALEQAVFNQLPLKTDGPEFTDDDAPEDLDELGF